MNTSYREDDTLSALLDGELSDQDSALAIRRLGGDAEQRSRYADYCLIGDVLRGHHHDIPDLTDKVMAALEQEPTVLAPQRHRFEQRPLLWLAAAAVAAITWGLWSMAPREETPLPMASLASHAGGDVTPYLAAHQDYAQAVVAPQDMHFTRVSLHGAAR